MWVRACPACHRRDIKEKHVLLPATIKLLKKKKKGPPKDEKFPRRFMLWEGKSKEETPEFRRY